MAFSLWWWLTALILLTISSPISTMPPPPPVHCTATGCTLSNSYGLWGDRKDCRVPTIIYPETEHQLLQAVAHASKNKLKVKVATKFSHTIPKLACPGTNSGKEILISTEKYNSKIEVDVENFLVTADSGVILRDLIDEVEENGLSLVAAPYWEGLSVGGVISTGAHGSSWWGRGGAVHDHVIGISLIVPADESQGFARIVKLDDNDELFKAAKVSLGMLGVISQVTFLLEKGFKRSIAYNFANDSGIEVEFANHAKQHEFADIAWYPSQYTAVYRSDDRVSLNTSGNGVNDFLAFQSQLISVSQAVRLSEKAMEGARNTSGKCNLASTSLESKRSNAFGLKNTKEFNGYPVIGHQGKMQTSGSCLHSPLLRIDTACAWDPRINGLSFYESAAIFPVTKFLKFVRDVKRLRDIKPEKFCEIDVYNGMLIRFVKASDAYLGQRKDSVVVDFSYFRADEASTPRLNQDLMEEVEQMAFFKYGARPHWGKNRNLAFSNVRKKYPNFGKFVAAKKELDTFEVFSSQWSDEILFGKEALSSSDGCALEGECVCSEDRHCSPSKGYLCKEGLIYKEARVCKYTSSDL